MSTNERICLHFDKHISDMIAVTVWTFQIVQCRHIARNVRQAVLTFVRRHGNVSESEATAVVAEFECLGRYQRNVWIT